MTPEEFCEMSHWLRIDDRTAVSVDCIPDGNGAVLVTRVFVPTRRRCQGYGTAAMEKLCDTADRCKIRLRLVVAPYDESINVLRLLNFYRRFGFSPSIETTMIRLPSETA